ncbi:DUF4097 family beta strand repeat-containing protein [Bacillus sp. JCM 19034]|uniref:DUF4097 family beta strand repeat-containing protein n=1 Tax=Bacillus sp. JCM 19034 TaxID=1481928 RepID=UPI000781420A|nr:DUF4097 family beta strand repeat-containing protein [Bacillus sp. JCM 19034]
MKQITLSIVLVVFVLIGCNLETVEREQHVELEASQIEKLVIDHDEGDVTLVVNENASLIEVEATFSAISTDEELAKSFLERNLSLSLEESDEGALLKTSVKRIANETEEGNVHLAIAIPAHIQVELKHNEGNLHIQGLQADIAIQHGTDNVTLENIEANVTVTDGAGNVLLQNVTGETSINNATGDTIVANSSGQISITNGKGAIQIDNYSGMVAVRNGSGEISIDTVDGDVTVIESAQGEVKIENVSGEVTRTNE